MQFKETTKNKNYIYKGKILNLRKDDIILPNGKPAIREIIEHSGGAGILALSGDSVLLVKQFRYAFNKEIYEIPAGKLNVGEDPLETARRELEEECGYLAKDLTLLYKAYASPGYTEEIVYIYKAENLTKTSVHLDEDEFLSYSWVKLDKVKEMIKSGEICDGKTLIALLSILDI